MRKRTIAIFIPSYRIGGAEKVLILLANNFLQHYERVQMLSTTSEGPLQAQLDPRVERIDLGTGSYRRILFLLRDYFDAHRPDAVLTSIYATGIVAAAARVLSRHKPALLVGAHNSFSAKLAAPDNVKDKYLLKPLSRLFFPRADAIVSVSRGVSDDLARTLGLAPGKLHVIYNPVVSPELAVKASAQLDHPWLGDPALRPFKTLVSVGRVVPQKGYEVLLRAFAKLPRVQERRLVLVGDGPELPMLKELAHALGIAALVDFVGYDTNPYRYMARADLFVLSSHWEGLPTVLIEAIACGCPVAATDCPYGPSEILEDGKYGQLAPVADPDSLARSIERALEGSKDREGLRRRLADRTAIFSEERATSEYVGLIDALLDRRLPA